MSENDHDLTSPSDRRESDRKKLIVDVRFDGGDGTGIANTRDIGVGGLYMTTSSTLDIGASVLMKVSVRGRPVDLPGVVVYSDPGQGVGVRFKNVADDDLEYLKHELALG